MIKAVRPFARVFVVAPAESQSGQSHSITIKNPLRATLIEEDEDYCFYTVNGTPVDCVKLGLDQLVDRTPDYILSGINHGSNAGISVLYSGTMGAAIEGGLHGIPSIGFSLLDHHPDADFTLAVEIVKELFQSFMKQPRNTVLNVNIPNIPADKCKGYKVCKQTNGVWKGDFEKREDPSGREYYWLTGYFANFEVGNKSSDEWALNNDFVAIVPVKVDMTDYDHLEALQSWEIKDEQK